MNVRMLKLAVIGGIIAAAGCMTGCVSPPAPRARFDDIRCHYTFTGMESKAEKERVMFLIRKYARAESLHLAGDVESGPEYSFVVEKLSALDELHHELIYGDPAGRPERPQRLNYRDVVFSVHYDEANLGAAIETIVRFRATPGARLFYKPQGEEEKDITALVKETGDVELRARIHKGQEFIYARAVSGHVSKHIRINLFTQEVQEIARNEYP